MLDSGSSSRAQTRSSSTIVPSNGAHHRCRDKVDAGPEPPLGKPAPEATGEAGADGDRCRGVTIQIDSRS